MATRQKVLSAVDFLGYDSVTYSSVAVIKVKPFDAVYMMQNTSQIDGYVTLKKSATSIAEIEDINIDMPSSIGKFAIGSDNVLKIIVDKTVVTNIDQAKAELTGYTAYYKLASNLAYQDNLFEVNTINEANSNIIFNSVLLDGDKTMSYIKNLIQNIDLSESDGIKFEILPVLKTV